MWLAGCTLIGGLAASAFAAVALPQEREAQSKEKPIDTKNRDSGEPMPLSVRIIIT